MASSKLRKNENLQAIITIILIILVVFGFWYGTQIVLNTKYPALAVESGSMDTISDGQSPGWTHPFARTLEIGDLIIVQGISPANLSTVYPNSDIIVFHRPDDPSDLIVHRIVAVEEVNGTYYFRTKGDGNGVDRWPAAIQSYEYDPWGWVSQNLVVGKVVMRIPLIGYFVLFMRGSPVGILAIVFLIMLLIIIEFVVPLLRGKRTIPNGN